MEQRRTMVGLLWLASFAAAGYGQQTEEYRVKAAFLFHFAQMVDWPADKFGDDKRAMTICTIGKDPFGGELESTLQGKSIGSRQVQIRHLKQTEEALGCQVLFVGGNERKQVLPALEALKDPAILTVGESDDFARQGGMIGFCMENSKVRFDINLDAATRARLKISSRLLLLAKSVIGSHS